MGAAAARERVGVFFSDAREVFVVLLAMPSRYGAAPTFPAMTRVSGGLATIARQ
ncbi:hypothetical protein KAE78_12015 [Microbacterium sp. NIBRBAC000506063]|nr:hypothetical protein KAE78_12015 [Microbacterium sp. NIBRBAC000506063]